AHLDSNGDASYNFELLSEFPEAPRSAQEYFTNLGREPLAVHFGSLGAHLNPGSEKVLDWIKLLHPHATICYDPNIRPIISENPEKLKNEVTQYLEYVDVFKGNTEDIAEIFPSLSIAEAASEILAAGPSLVVISAGADGLTMHTKSHQVEIPALDVTVVDTVGAGDSLTAALIDGLGRISLLGREDSKHIETMSRSMLTSLGYYAASAASITVTRRGANPPTRAEISAQSEMYLIKDL
ncbi:MAG: PfkB family carbohydrate kinase, partial [Arcanobacterium sp.]|nr:PfkB family carbohydrate kinase [Arcanobacterium sp.]